MGKIKVYSWLRAKGVKTMFTSEQALFNEWPVVERRLDWVSGEYYVTAFEAEIVDTPNDASNAEDVYGVYGESGELVCYVRLPKEIFDIVLPPYKRKGYLAKNLWDALHGEPSTPAFKGLRRHETD